MIAKLRGIIDTIGDDYCIVDVNGVGYLVFASGAPDKDRMPLLGAPSLAGQASTGSANAAG